MSTFKQKNRPLSETMQIVDKPVYAKKALQSLPQRQKDSNCVVSGDMCVGNDTSHAGSG